MRATLVLSLYLIAMASVVACAAPASASNVGNYVVCTYNGFRPMYPTIDPEKPGVQPGSTEHKAVECTLQFAEAASKCANVAQWQGRIGDTPFEPAHGTFGVPLSEPDTSRGGDPTGWHFKGYYVSIGKCI